MFKQSLFLLVSILLTQTAYANPNGSPPVYGEYAYHCRHQNDNSTRCLIDWPAAGVEQNAPTAPTT